MSHPPLSVVKVAGSIDILVRDACPADVPDIHRIYAFSVMNGTGSFDETPPTFEDMVKKHADLTSRSLPFLVAEHRGHIVGFSYAAPFRPRSAYRYTLEDSVYVGPDTRGLGVGRTLLQSLIKRCRALGYHQLVAVIGDSTNQSSIRAHTAAGFQYMGQLNNVGLKFGSWLDIVFMQCVLDDGAAPKDTGDKAEAAI